MDWEKWFEQNGSIRPSYMFYGEALDNFCVDDMYDAFKARLISEKEDIEQWRTKVEVHDSEELE